MGVKFKKRKRKSHQRTDGQGATVLLPRATTSGGALRVGTLSWSLRKGENLGQSVEAFLDSLNLASQERRPCDLIVASGKAAAALPTPEGALAASGGIPVLFEALTRGGRRSWFVAYSRSGRFFLTMLRRSQLVESSSDDDATYASFVEAIAGGAGVIRFDGSALTFVLFICGENNVPQCARRTCVLRGASDESRNDGRIEAVLGGPWVLLNPSHRPYWPHVGYTGFFKVGTLRLQDGRVFGPTLRRLAAFAAGFRDGTRTPVAVVHLNSFDPEKAQTLPYASVVFGDSAARTRQVQGPTHGTVDEAGNERAAHWRYCVYEINELLA